MCRGFLDGKIPYLESKNTSKEFEMVRNKHQEDSADDKEGNNGLEAMISSFGFMTQTSSYKKV